MVKDIQNILSKYSVNIDEETVDARSSFITADDTQKSLPSIQIHFVDERIYSLTFVNNEFFEIPDDDLFFVLQSILQGTYEVKKNVFGRYSIKIKEANRYILPERLHKIDKNQQKEVYASLPRAFSIK